MEDGPTSAMRECNGIDLQNPPKPDKSIALSNKRRLIADLIINFRGYKGEFIRELNKMMSNDKRHSLDDFKKKLDEIQNLISELQSNFSEQKHILTIDKLNLETAFVNAETCLIFVIGKNETIKDHKIFCAIQEALQDLHTIYLDPIPVDSDPNFPSDNGFTIH